MPGSSGLSCLFPLAGSQFKSNCLWFSLFGLLSLELADQSLTLLVLWPSLGSSKARNSLGPMLHGFLGGLLVVTSPSCLSWPLSSWSHSGPCSSLSASLLGTSQPWVPLPLLASLVSSSLFCHHSGGCPGFWGFSASTCPSPGGGKL